MGVDAGGSSRSSADEGASGAPTAAQAPAALASLAAPAAAEAAAASLAEGAITRSPGSRWYRPPELLLGACEYGPPADMWSLGCVLAEMISGKTLLLGSSSANQLLKVCQLAGGKPDGPTLADLHADTPPARALLAALPSAEPPTRLNKLTPSGLAKAIKKVIDNPSFYEAAKESGKQIAAEDGVADTIGVLEKYIEEKVDTGEWKKEMEAKWVGSLKFQVWS